MKDKIVDLIREYINNIKGEEILSYQGQWETAIQEREKECKVEILEELLDNILRLENEK